MTEFEVGVPKPPHHAACPLLCQIFEECSTPRPPGADGFDAGVLYERQRVLTRIQSLLKQAGGGRPMIRAENPVLSDLRDFIVGGEHHTPDP